MMQAYFSEEQKSNLWQLPITFDNFPFAQHLETVGFQLNFTDNYDNHGIYFVSVKEYADHWSGLSKRSDRHILYEIPFSVIEAARARKVIIVIDNSSEGFPLIVHGVDAFKEMHQVMKNLNLPSNSVLLIDNNKKLLEQYNKWCIENFVHPMFDHIDFLTGFYYFHNRVPEIPLLKYAIENVESKDFLSMNRTARPHRVDHLYTLAKKGLLSKGLVSGNYTNRFDDDTIPKSLIKRVGHNDYERILTSICPLNIDGDWTEENPDHYGDCLFNHEIYKQSYISFVTETAFQQEGLFITEKIFKPIVAGHPFIVLGQPFFLKELREMGYRTDFPGIDQTYDEIIDPIERFDAAHRSLERWTKYDRDTKIHLLKESIPIVEHNLEVYKSHDYEIESFQSLFKKIHKMFRYEKNKLR